MNKFQCWYPDAGHDGPDDGKEIEDWEAESAAADYVEQHYSDWEYPSSPVVVHVRDESGATFVVNVEVRTEEWGFYGRLA